VNLLLPKCREVVWLRRVEELPQRVAGSPLGPWLMPRSFMDAQAKWFPEGTLEDLSAMDQHRDDYNILGWEIEPGDAVCFHRLALIPPPQL
jgi:hypothetical protein